MPKTAINHQYTYLFRCNMCRVFLAFVLVASANCGRIRNDVIQSFIDHEIVPDILSAPPLDILSVTFPNGVEVLGGNILTIEQVAGDPSLQWNADPDSYYTLVLCDADAPSRTSPDARSYLHWLVVNLPGADLVSGETIIPRLPSHPEGGTGAHRYVFLIYKQPRYVRFDQLPEATFEGRKNFSVQDFASKYFLEGPIAGNFYQTENLED